MFHGKTNVGRKEDGILKWGDHGREEKNSKAGGNEMSIIFIHLCLFHLGRSTSREAKEEKAPLVFGNGLTSCVFFRTALLIRHIYTLM